MLLDYEEKRYEYCARREMQGKLAKWIALFVSKRHPHSF